MTLGGVLWATPAEIRRLLEAKGIRLTRERYRGIIVSDYGLRFAFAGPFSRRRVLYAVADVLSRLRFALPADRRPAFDAATAALRAPTATKRTA